MSLALITLTVSACSPRQRYMLGIGDDPSKAFIVLENKTERNVVRLEYWKWGYRHEHVDLKSDELAPGKTYQVEVRGPATVGFWISDSDDSKRILDVGVSAGDTKTIQITEQPLSENETAWRSTEELKAEQRAERAAREAEEASSSGGASYASSDEGDEPLPNGAACYKNSDCASWQCRNRECVRKGKGLGIHCRSTSQCRGDLVCSKGAGSNYRCWRN